MPDPTKVAPAKRAPWPPPNYLIKRYVSLEDSFKSLATFYGRTDVWDIIFFNFRTRKPEVVNWYLYHYVECRAKTPDGKNYRFSSVDREKDPLGMGHPIFVFIPHGWWTPPSPESALDEQARAAILGVLTKTPASNLSLALGSMELRPGNLLSVAHAITTDKIIVRYAAGARAAIYSPKQNVLASPYLSTPDAISASLMVHEAVHMTLDLRGVNPTMMQSEALAYVAQCLYMIRRGIAEMSWAPHAWQYMFHLALKINSGQTLSPQELNVLFANIPNVDPIYRNMPSPENDGV